MPTDNRDKVEICRVCDIVEDEIKGAELLNPERVALYDFGGRIYATSDICTHGEASLSEEGLLTGKIVECAWLFGTFDITTGKPESSPCTVPLKTFPVEVTDGMIYVEY